jgi:hypothetical protein
MSLFCTRRRTKARAKQLTPDLEGKCGSNLGCDYRNLQCFFAQKVNTIRNINKLLSVENRARTGVDLCNRQGRQGL